LLLLLEVLLLEVSLPLLLRAVPSRLSPNASPLVLLLPPSCELALSAAPWEEVS